MGPGAKTRVRRSSMSEKKPVDQQIVDYLKKKGTATVDEVAAAVKIGRTSARQYLAGLTVDKRVMRASGGRQGRRKLPDNFTLPEKERGGKAIERSSGAVANCLARLEKQGKVRLTKPKPRSYELAGAEKP